MKLVSLKRRLLLQMSLACTLIVLVVSFYQLYQHQQGHKQQLREEFSNFERGAKQLIREAVWLYDWARVKTIIESQTSQLISFIEICDDEADKCLQYGVLGLEPYLEYRRPIIYQEPVSGKPIEIGGIFLQGHYDDISSHILEDLPHLLLTNVLSVFGIAIIIFFLFHRQAVRRLVEIENYTHRIDLLNIDGLEPLEFKKNPHSQDEIDLLADAVTGLVGKIKDEFERRKLLEQQLGQSLKMEALGTLAGGIAHDFNNILAAILGYAQLSYAGSEPGSKLQNRLGQIISAGQRAKGLISQILVFSRRSEANREVLRLAGVVDEALSLIRASLPANIQFETELDEGIRVLGDSTQLHQVIMNLAANAGQAMNESGGRLTTDLTRVELLAEKADLLAVEPGFYACLKIVDNGPGIAEEIQARVFEPFFTTKQVGKGTGMGLAVVHGIVQTHGGAIRLDSKPEAGTTFTIYLPETTEGIVEEAQSEPLSTGCGEQILIVDDEIAVAEMGRETLQGLGYKVSIFTDPCVALKYFVEGMSTDLLITDLTMPELSGIELAREIKQRQPELPVLLWSGFADALDADAIDEGLISQVLHKPFTVETLARSVRQVLDSQHQVKGES